MLMLAREVEQVLGRCTHCLATVTVATIPSLEAFLRFEAEGHCATCRAMK